MQNGEPLSGKIILSLSQNFDSIKCCFLLSVEIYGEQQSRYFLEGVLTILGR